MRCTLAGHTFYLEPSDVNRAMRGVTPEGAETYVVRVGEHDYPIAQVAAAISGQDRADMTSTEIRRTLRQLGFDSQTRALDG